MTLKFETPIILTFEFRAYSHSTSRVRDRRATSFSSNTSAPAANPIAAARHHERERRDPAPAARALQRAPARSRRSYRSRVAASRSSRTVTCAPELSS